MSARTGRPAGTWRALLAAIPFLASMGLLGFALNTGALVTFAIFWPLIQIAGYIMSLRVAKGSLAHPMVTSQIALHWLMLGLVVALVVRTV